MAYIAISYMATYIGNYIYITIALLSLYISYSYIYCSHATCRDTHALSAVYAGSGCWYAPPSSAHLVLMHVLHI